MKIPKVACLRITDTVSHHHHYSSFNTELTIDLYTCGHDDDPYKRMCFPGSGFTGKTWSCCQSAKFQQSGGFFTIIYMLSSYYKKRVFIHKFLCCCRLCIFSTFCWVIILYLHCSTNQEIVGNRLLISRKKIESRYLQHKINPSPEGNCVAYPVGV